MLSDLEVPLLNLLLGLLDALVQPRMVDGFSRLHADAGHDALHLLAAEQPHQVVVHGDVELGASRITLTAGASPQLVVDAAALVAFRTHDVETAQVLHLLVVCKPLLLLDLQGSLKLLRRGAGASPLPGPELRVTAQLDVGTTSCHVGGDGDGTLCTCLRNDEGLAGMVLGVQHLVAHTAAGQKGGKVLRLLDGDGAHQYGLALAVAFDDLLADGLPLVVFGHVDLVVLVLSCHRLVGGNHHHLQSVDLVELHRLGLGGTGHAGKLVVHAEEVLEGDGGQGSVPLGNADVLLGLDGLVESVAVAAALQDTSGELVYNLHLAVPHHVVHIGLVEGVGPHRLGEVVDVLEVALLKEAAGNQVALLEDFFYFKHSLVGEGDPA